MRNSLTKVASLALLAGALIVPAVPASATTTTAAHTAKVADDPFAVFKINLKASKTAKAGGHIKYSLTATNTGPYSADAWFVGGQFPKGVDLRKIRYSAPKGTICALDGRALYCSVPYVLEKDDWVRLVFDAKLKKNAKGAQKATLGVITYDVQQGMWDQEKGNWSLAQEELERLGIPEHGYAKSATTRIVR
ncbi:hypothetical protein DMB42_39650 [Nonomuraea sp. WAC 01424]|uniref:DUF11 domain-containing protein n=1 Tax=Nonomuraea sp. WAC 01424 TaxID=2203200 RepID=UPI000F7A390A|nr:DUF11 domain-containing protein [Nonomuraea sp. WAC 01424]RSN01115.1 hypothetical protein DMB42_39650 [Nonomuraea sp. WAC 01424]